MLDEIMTVATSRQSLVLNADFRPLSIYPISLISGRDAVEAVLRDRVIVVEEWPEAFRSPSVHIRVPKTVALRHYAQINASPKFCRHSIFLRDGYRCQYCGQEFPPHELTYDHVIPRQNGGDTSWENILTACVDCNTLKRNQHANWGGKRGRGVLRPLKEPRQPTTAELLRAGLHFVSAETRETWADWLYWTTELQA